MRTPWVTGTEALRKRMINPQQVAPTDSEAEMPPYMESFLSHLRLLVGVPFEYLIPDPRLPGSEIDPFLSALAGSRVLVAAVPPFAHPTLANFVTGANAPNMTDLGDFRTLRPDTRSYDFNLAYATRFRTKNGLLPETAMTLEQLVSIYGETYNDFTRK